MEADRALDAAFDARETERVESHLAIGKAKSLSQAEARRVKAILAREQRERAEADARYIAEIQIASGHLGTLEDTFLRPTPEWLSKGETRTFIPRQRNDTTRVIRTVRRVLTPIVYRMNRKGLISDEALRACLWFRQIHELAKLDGRYAVTHFSDPQGAAVSRRTGAMGGHIPVTLVEAEARRAFRAASEALPAQHRSLFNKIALEDIPIYRACLTKRERGAATKIFCRMAEALARHCEANEADLKLIDRG